MDTDSLILQIKTTKNIFKEMVINNKEYDFSNYSKDHPI